MKVGDFIRVQKYTMGYPHYQVDYVVEEFRHCLGIFLSGDDRTAQNFTPLCELYTPAPDAKKGYISHYGEYYDKYVQNFMNITKIELTEN